MLPGSGETRQTIAGNRQTEVFAKRRYTEVTAIHLAKILVPSLFAAAFILSIAIGAFGDWRVNPPFWVFAAVNTFINPFALRADWEGLFIGVCLGAVGLFIPYVFWKKSRRRSQAAVELELPRRWTLLLTGASAAVGVMGTGVIAVAAFLAWAAHPTTGLFAIPFGTALTIWAYSAAKQAKGFRSCA